MSNVPAQALIPCQFPVMAQLRAKAWKRRFPNPLSREYMHGTVILDRRLIDIPDVQAHTTGPLAPGAKNFLASGYRAVTIMPMIRGDAAIGAISVIRLAPGPLSVKQTDLLRTFANQAVIAIENVRLFDEVQARTCDLSEALEQQTATSEILGVISSSPGDLEPVFQAMLANATRLCEANFGSLYLYEGDAFRITAMHNAPPAYEEVRRREPVMDHAHPAFQAILGRLTKTNMIIHITDLMAVA